MGLVKALNPGAFLELVREYHIVNNSLILNSIAAALPWFEVICGLLLVAGVAVRGTAVVTLGMLVPFTVTVLRRALTIASVQKLAFCAVKFDCGCGNGPQFICKKLVENSALILLSCWLIFSASRYFCAHFELFKRD
ncbi:MAG: hypothetical protein C5B50_16855 [Verrucomicrobia bacterium]|nr:MAG: hypothetical protein C5B50_16855 [Verrucomicrobiota bacterium]